jgi:hypothetical protein
MIRYLHRRDEGRDEVNDFSASWRGRTRACTLGGVAVVTPLPVGLDHKTVPWLRWSRPADDPQVRDGADPLGFRAAANRAARRIAPGLTQSTSSIRAFGLVLVGLDLAMGSRNPDETFQRFERLWVLASEATRAAGVAVDRFPGSQRAQRMLNGSTGTLDLARPVLSSQLSTGLWGAYRRAAVHFELIQRQGSNTRPSAHKLTAAGHRVRLATWAEIRFGQPQLSHWLKVGVIGRDRPVEWLQPGIGCSAREAAALSAEIRRVDGDAGGPLGRLREHFEHTGGLALSRLRLSSLTDDQSDAVRTARAIDRLMDEIEAPFRSWVAGGKAAPPPHWREVASHPDWNVVLCAGEHDLAHLQQALADRPHVESVRSHHRWLCEQRGARPWEPNDQDKEHLEPADFGLSAPRLLFSDGLLG